MRVIKPSGREPVCSNSACASWSVPKRPTSDRLTPALKEQLREERSGILAWLVRGCLAFQQQGLAIPSSITLSTEKYRDEEDTILHFLNECCVLRPEALGQSEYAL